MKRLLLFPLFIACLSTGYGQVGRTKQTTRLAADSVVLNPSGKGSAQLIDGLQNVQTRTGGQVSNSLLISARQQRSLPAIPKQSLGSTAANNPAWLANAQTPPLKGVGGFSGEPQSVFIERPREQSQLRSAIIRSPQETAFDFFKETPQLKIPNPELQIRIDTIETDPLNMTHVKGTQLYRNIPVYGMNFTFHISSESERFLGYMIDTTLIQASDARIEAADAVRITESDLSQTTVIRTPSMFMKNTLNYERPSVETIYYPVQPNVYYLCYKVIIRPNARDEWFYYINAVSGEVVDKYNNTHFDGAATGSGRDLNGVTRTVGNYLENGRYYMINISKPMFNTKTGDGLIAILDAKNDIKFHDTNAGDLIYNTSTTWNNPTAISAMYHCTVVYDYLINTFKRNSYDNKGTNMRAFINVCDEEVPGAGYDNAYWNGAIIAIGNGDIICKPLAGGLDVIAHEWGHAMTSTTAKLEYRNQSGAINETFSDILGAMVDRSNWQIGEAIMNNRTYFPTNAMRDMSNPHNGGRSTNDPCWQPAHVSEMYLGTQDNGGVHTNSGITNYAYYQFATATSKEKAEQIFYRALTTYLTPTSKFIDLRKAVIQSARDLNYANDVQALSNAFDKVGIVDDTVTPPPPADLPTNPGGWGMLLCNTDPSDRNSLYKTTNYTTFTPISQTVMYSTPSVTDDGKFAIFVDNRNNIRILDMTTGKESIFNNEGDNQSVAISRDGKRVAVISTAEDARIWVYNIATDKWMAFKLYNPTTGSGGAKSGGPRYADAIEFDHTGENIIYDAYNRAGSALGGKTVEYWDIGLINVWNNSRNTWGTGEVVKLFSDLSSGVSVMNPVFSKNSPFIIAFDYYDDEDGNYTLGVNLATGDLKAMFSNNMPSYPSYSMDDKRIAFTTMGREAQIGYFNLGSNKITATGNPVGVVSGAAFPVYYGTGSRELGTKPVASFTVDTRSGGAPLNVQFVDMSEGNPTSWRWTFTGGSPSSSTQQHPKVTYNALGTYAVTLVATNSYGSGELVRSGYITVSTTGTELVMDEPLSVYPNPATDIVLITGISDQMIDINLYDLTGKAVPATFALTDEQNKIRLNINHLPRGIYFLHITLPKGATVTRKLIKN